MANPARTRKTKKVEAEPRSTTERILDAAEVRFARSGYDATSLGDIADDVGIRTPSLYKHFESKRDLYVAVVERLLSPYFELLDRLLTVPEDAEQAEKNLFAVTRFYLETPNLARVVQHAALAGGEELELLVERWYLPLFRRATQLTETAPLLAGEAKKALSVVIAFHSMMSGYVTMAPLHARLMGRDPGSKAAIDEQLELMHGLSALLWR
ncbi:MAG: TetR/AcrR family transcriptional regulator [Polyangiales bacterium]